MEASSALVLSTDALAAALLGALVELEGYAPRFAHADEPARDALRRLRPAVVLIDCGWAEACGAAVIGPATMIGVRVLLFGRPAVAHVVRACAEEFGVPVLALPPAPGELRQALAERAG
ncbi:MAG: hypothetical protein AVDCRST_MAG11-601 [uncultured Gemmatimonadaceae bacterium]|uniref:Response regulatory domain-containing protein n=1 Tax=uncultured Gemmatimonadaceae bacterium TaxID=246130 RepID=A0A6J4K6E1_9BACT|nr:MAG: hypothetical protein AVDCRST_MAG11-601 [uncultured Gemmatimonadaceae bacterium]